jgi:heptaprenylglyceryl phosphate synthase
MTRRFSQMLMAFLFPNKTQDIQQSNKTTIKHPTSNSFKRRTRSTEVRKNVDFLFFFTILNSQNSEISFVDNI